MKRIAHMTSVHPVCDVRIFHRECKTLCMHGYHVELIASNDTEEMVEGVNIRPLPNPNGRGERIFKMTLPLLRNALAAEADLYHFHDPELIPAGILLKLIGKKVVYDVHEDVPRQILDKKWIKTWLRLPISKGAELFEWIANIMFDGIVAATPTIAKRFHPPKTIVIQNFPIVDEFRGTDSYPYKHREPVIVYLGSIAHKRGAKEIVEAISMVPASYNCKLQLAGYFSPDSLREELQKLSGWAQVYFKGLLDREGVARLLGSARIGLVILHPTQAYLASYPIKLFEYMAAGIPVIASNFPLWSEIVNGAKCGLLVNPFHPPAIAEAICFLLDHPQEAEAMGNRGVAAVRERYNWQPESRKLLDFYKNILG